MTLSPRIIEIVDEYWASDLGCAREDLRPRAPRVREHAGGLKGYRGVFILTVGQAPLVSVPPELVTLIVPRAAAFDAAAVADPSRLRELLSPADITLAIGPAHLSYADASSFASPDVRNARALTASDRDAFDALRAACLPEDWDPKGFGLDTRPTFGAFGEDGGLLAVASFEIWGNRIAHLSVVSHPEARNRGHGTRAVGATAMRALESGLILQYRALEENRASLRVAANLGFQAYGWSIAARLRET